MFPGRVFLAAAFGSEIARYPLPYVMFVVIDADFGYASHKLHRLRRISYPSFLCRGGTKPRFRQNYAFLYIP